MHELSLALSLIDLVVEQSIKTGGERILQIHVQVGPLSGVVVETLRSAFDAARVGTVVETANLIVEETIITTDCDQCGQTTIVESPIRLTCGRCSNPATQIRTGREFHLVALELAEGDE